MGCGCNLRKRITKNRLSIDNQKDVYLDYNSTTKPDNDVLALTEKLNRTLWGNPSSQNSRGVFLYNTIESELKKVKAILNCKDYEAFFDTSSTSIINKIKNRLTNTTLITTTIEHSSLLNNSNIHVDVDSNGKVNTDKIKTFLKSTAENSILIYSPVNHELGSIQNCEAIYTIAKRFKTPVILDCVQAISKLDKNSWLPFCDGFYYSGHKIHGLQGSAVLFVKKDLFSLQNKDTTLPFSLYEGTFNTTSSMALLYATKKLIQNFSNYKLELGALTKDAYIIIKKLQTDVIIESPLDAVPGIINISLPNIKNIEDLMLHLNAKGIHISRLSSCSGDITDDSYVLKATGRKSRSYKKSLRISFGKDSKRDDFYRLCSAIKEFISSSKSI